LFLRWKELAKKNKADKIPLKEDDQEESDRIAEKLKNAVALRENAKTQEEKLAAVVLLDEARALSKEVRNLVIAVRSVLFSLQLLLSVFRIKREDLMKNINFRKHLLLKV
jgi:hypothetical protein